MYFASEVVAYSSEQLPLSLKELKTPESCIIGPRSLLKIRLETKWGWKQSLKKRLETKLQKKYLLISEAGAEPDK